MCRFVSQLICFGPRPVHSNLSRTTFLLTMFKMSEMESVVFGPPQEANVPNQMAFSEYNPLRSQWYTGGGFVGRYFPLPDWQVQRRWGLACETCILGHDTHHGLHRLQHPFPPHLSRESLATVQNIHCSLLCLIVSPTVALCSPFAIELPLLVNDK